MKNLSFILLVLFAVGFAVSTTSCGGDDTGGTPVPTDTTEVVTYENTIEVGFDLYELDVRANLTEGFFESATNNTVIFVSGNDGSEGDADFNITVPGKDLGTYTTSGDGATFEAGTGAVGDVRRTEYNADATPMTIVITEYGDVGERIKGTFSGQVKNTSSQTLDIKNGKFDVERTPDK